MLECSNSFVFLTVLLQTFLTAYALRPGMLRFGFFALIFCRIEYNHSYCLIENIDKIFAVNYFGDLMVNRLQPVFSS